MPVSVDLGQFVELQTGARPKTQSITVPTLANLGNYPYQVDMRGAPVEQPQLDAMIRAADKVFFTEYLPDGHVHIVEAGNVGSQKNNQYLAIFDNRLALVSTRILAGADEAGVALTWECLGPLNPDETIFVHRLDHDGRVIAQADGDPLDGLFPLAGCKAGEQIQDVRWFNMSTRLGDFSRVGVYNRSTNQRLIALDPNGQLIPDYTVEIGSINQ